MSETLKRHCLLFNTVSWWNAERVRRLEPPRNTEATFSASLFTWNFRSGTTALPVDGYWRIFLQFYRTIPAQWLLFSCHAMYQKGQEDTCPRKIKQVEEYYTFEKKRMMTQITINRSTRSLSAVFQIAYW
jgi:hypothetical protein